MEVLRTPPPSAEPLGPTSSGHEVTRLRDLSPQQWKSGIAAWLGWLFDGLDMHLYVLVAAPFVGVHLTFLALALMNGFLDAGRGLVRTILVVSALALSHLIWAYMAAISFAVLFVVGLRRATWPSWRSSAWGNSARVSCSSPPARG